MQLNSRQLRQLQKLRDYRRTPPTVAALLRSGWRAYLYLTTVGLVGVGVFHWGRWPMASGLFAGMVLATFIRDMGWYRRQVQFWPLQEEITDWPRVEQLLGHLDETAA